MLGCIKWIFNLFVSCALNLVKRLNRHGVIICYLTFFHLSGEIREFVRLTIMKLFENSHVWTVKLMLQLLLLCLSFTFRRTVEVVFDRRHLLQMVLTSPTSTLLSSSFSFGWEAQWKRTQLFDSFDLFSPVALPFKHVVIWSPILQSLKESIVFIHDSFHLVVSSYVIQTCILFGRFHHFGSWRHNLFFKSDRYVISFFVLIRSVTDKYTLIHFLRWSFWLPLWFKLCTLWWLLSFFRAFLLDGGVSVMTLD